MPVKAGTLIANLAKRAGTELTPEQIEALSTLTLELPDEVEQGFQKNLFTADDAKKDPELKKHFHGQVHSTLDSKLAELIEELGFDELQKAELAKVSNTYEKPKALADQIAKLQEKKFAATGSKEKVTLQGEIDQLKAKQAEIENGHKAAIEKMGAEFKEKNKNFLVKQLLGANEFGEAFDKETAIEVAQVKLNKILGSKGAKLILTDNDELKIVDANGDQFREDNKDLNFADLSKSFLAESKMLKVNAAPPPVTPPKNEFQPDNTKQIDLPPIGVSDIYSTQIAAFQN